MRGRLPAIAAGCLLGLLAVTVLLALRPAAEPTASQRADALAAELRCPDCQGLSVADSPTASAQEIRRQIDELIAGGATDDEVRAHFVARYGEWIRLAPSAGAAWAIPFVALAIGVLLLSAWLVRHRPPASTAVAVPGDERRRLHEEAEALDA